MLSIKVQHLNQTKMPTGKEQIEWIGMSVNAGSGFVPVNIWFPFFENRWQSCPHIVQSHNVIHISEMN